MAASGEVVAGPAVPGVELGRLVGRGGTCEVWEGVREADDRRVAVKVATGEHADVEAAVREASLAAVAAGAHVVPVEACLPLADGRVALVMPLLRGGDLARLVAARGHLAPGEVVTVLAPVAGALGRLHRAGVTHGDLSPGNVLLDLDGRPWLADLGTGRVVGEEPTAVWGTEGYLAPEVLMGEEPGPAADVYALGALGWLCLTGGPPGPPGLRPPLSRGCRAGEGATSLVEVVESAVAPHPADRPTADELAWSLFGAAPAAPLHLVEGDDEVSAVTFRLRAAASRAAVAEPPRGRGRHARHARVERGRWRRPPWPAGLLALSVAAVVGAGVAVTGTGVVRAPAAPGATAPPAAPAVTGTVAPTTSPPTVDPTAWRGAPASRPRPLLEALAGARAAAWRAGDPRLLGEARTLLVILLLSWSTRQLTMNRLCSSLHASPTVPSVLMKGSDRPPEESQRSLKLSRGHLMHYVKQLHRSSVSRISE